MTALKSPFFTCTALDLQGEQSLLLSKLVLTRSYTTFAMLHDTLRDLFLARPSQDFQPLPTAS